MAQLSHEQPAAPRGPLGRALRRLLANQTTRRTVIFYVLLGALACVLFGGWVFPDWLRLHPRAFVTVWFICASLTFLAVVLALADVLMVRVTARVAERVLKSRYGIKDESAES